MQRRTRGINTGLILLFSQILRVGVSNIPPVTLATLALNIWFFLSPVKPLLGSCLSVDTCYQQKDWQRLLLSPFHHADDWHLYFNMASMLWKGINLERRLGSKWFAYIIVTFSLLTGVVYLLLEFALAELMNEPGFRGNCAVGFSGIDLYGRVREDSKGGVAVVTVGKMDPYLVGEQNSEWLKIAGLGFGREGLDWSPGGTSILLFYVNHSLTSCITDSWTIGLDQGLLKGVLFALKVLNNHYCPGGFPNVLGFPVPNRFACWAELVAIHFISPGTSFAGHLAGILVGLMYTLGPLKKVMEMCAGNFPSRVHHSGQQYYFNSAGYARYQDSYPYGGPGYSEEVPRNYDAYTAGLSEEEQLERALRASLWDRGNSTPGPPPYGFRLSPEEEMRRQQLRRFDRQ